MHANMCHVFSTLVYQVEPCREENSKFEPSFSVTFAFLKLRPYVKP